MPIQSGYYRVTNLYGRAGIVARLAHREVPASPAEALFRLDRQRRVLDAVRSLPEPYRSALFHCRIEGLAPAEAARRLRLPTATVEARLRHALRLLDQRLVRRAK
ncbi:MAG: RNA polymerase sigma factor [Planctomycetota bacterium]